MRNTSINRKIFRLLVGRFSFCLYNIDIGTDRYAKEIILRKEK
jgi:hypothetical protein